MLLAGYKNQQVGEGLMNIDSKTIISVTAANQNFSKVAQMVDENGQALIFKRNRPKYMMIDVNNAKVIDKAFEQIRDWQSGKDGAD